MSLTVSQQVAFYKRKLQILGDDIKYTRDLGKSALEDVSQITLFRGAYKESLGESYREFMSVWDELVKLDCLNSETQNFPDASEMVFYKAIRRYKQESYSCYEALQPPRPEPSSVQGGEGTLNLTQVSRLRLPRIKIPFFDGQPDSWSFFKATFEAIVHEDKEFSEIEKYHLLLGSLKGEALALVRNIPVSVDNYDQTWALLLRHYDNQRKLATSCLQKLIEFKSNSRLGVSGLRNYLLVVSEGIKTLNNLKIPNQGDFILFYLAMRGLDQETRQAFELQHADVDFPSCEKLTTWLENRLQALTISEMELVHQTTRTIEQKSPRSPNRFQPMTDKGSSFFTNSNSRMSQSSVGLKTDSGTQAGPSVWRAHCGACRGAHVTRECVKFLDMTPESRRNLLRSWKGCFNCLKEGHFVAHCPSKFRCRICNGNHHTLLHNGNPSSMTPQDRPAEVKSSLDFEDVTGTALASVTPKSSEVVLGTARATIAKTKGCYASIRLVIDPGSQYNFITSNVVHRLGLSIGKFDRAVVGVNQSPLSMINGQTSVKLLIPHHGILEADALVVPSITQNLPQVRLPPQVVELYQNHQLADVQFHEPGPIHFLLGAGLFPEIVTGAPILVHSDTPKLLPTLFGNVVLGKCKLPPGDRSTVSDISGLALFSADQTALGKLVERFWRQEEVSTFEVPASPEDMACEAHFKSTHYRLPTGRYSVALPFRSIHSHIVPARFKALKRLQAVEARLGKDHIARKDYRQFMEEYLALGHMSLSAEPGRFLIPHHAVYKKNLNQEAKIRVVFDAAFKSPSGSLNDHLLVGPRLQKDIADIVLNFRRHRIVITCDVVKMYRQIEVHPGHRMFQHILWRDSPDHPVQEFELNTITYGLSCSPFLALRVLEQLAEDEGETFPLAARAIKSDLYVDDVVTGSDSIENALLLKEQLIGLFARGQFLLSKWTSNCPQLLDGVSAECGQHSLSDPAQDTVTKVLGLLWDSQLDVFKYQVDASADPVLTKRGVLSANARIYDPLGLLAPVTFWAKYVFQTLWREGISWDEPIPPAFGEKWLRFWEDLRSLEGLQIPRRVTDTSAVYEIVGFCDASERGYGCAIYIRTCTQAQIKVHLLKAKTRLAPIKPMTIPRLELCGALLLARLYGSLEPFFQNFVVRSKTFFTDAAIVLQWLHTPPHNLKTFVAHRVMSILELTDVGSWRHVSSENNLADLCSRGALPSELVSSHTWFSGPEWLLAPQAEWPASDVTHSYAPLPELKTGISLCSVRSPDIIEWSERFSSFGRLIRSMAYILRFISHARGVSLHASKTISSEEFEEAKYKFVRFLQNHYFSPIDNPATYDRSLYGSLNVFMCDRGLLRVGGRLGKSELQYDQRFPLLLPKRCHFTRLLVEYIHKKLMHAGPTAMLFTIQREFWIPSVRGLLRYQRANCTVCVRATGRARQPYMGNLPSQRVVGVRPFQDTGVDFAGPFIVRESMRRRSLRSKAYLCIFICFSTKAIHLELVSSLSTEAFLDALEKFISRRGIPASITSDCGTNFVGAASYLKEIYSWFESSDTQAALLGSSAERSIRWNFNPPRAPHFGGLWEAAVRSVKSLLFKELGGCVLTWPELETMFCRIEAILNSRPLCPMSSDPIDLQALTPGHFLVGQPLTALPEHSFQNIPISRLSRWQILRERTQFFWGRWRKEYLNTLQQRRKWYRPEANLQVGDLVIVRDDNVAPMQWPLARVLTVHSGDDGVVRVVSIRTASGTYTRPVTKLVPLVCEDRLKA